MSKFRHYFRTEIKFLFRANLIRATVSHADVSSCLFFKLKQVVTEVSKFKEKMTTLFQVHTVNRRYYTTLCAELLYRVY